MDIDPLVEELIKRYRHVLDKLAGVGREVVSICPDCGHEIDKWDIEDGRDHVCPPKIGREA